MNVLSVFDGMSCGQLALKKAGIKVKNYFASEIKDHAITITQENFPDTIQLGDITGINGADLPQIDLYIGGSPCQDLSQAHRVREGLNGIKSKLFYQYVRVLQEVKPKYFLLENVRMKKKYQDKISSILGVEPIRICSSLVTGQLRKRLYWTNIQNIEQPKDTGVDLQSLLTSGFTDRIKSRCLLESDSRPLKNTTKMFHRYQKFQTLVFKDEQHYHDCRKHYNENFKDLAAKEIIYQGEPYAGIRHLNQTEMERLQAVPEGYTESLSRNDAACVLGDGWTVDVIAHIFKGMK